MSISAEKVISEALSLSPQARAYVAECLLESLDITPGEELSPAWLEEIQRRCRQMDEGTIQMRDASEVFAKAHASLR